MFVDSQGKCLECKQNMYGVFGWKFNEGEPNTCTLSITYNSSIDNCPVGSPACPSSDNCPVGSPACSSIDNCPVGSPACPSSD